MRKERDLRDALHVIKEEKKDLREELEGEGFSKKEIEESVEMARLDGMIEFAEFMQGREENEVAQMLRGARERFSKLSEEFSGIKPEA